MISLLNTLRFIELKKCNDSDRNGKEAVEYFVPIKLPSRRTVKAYYNSRMLFNKSR